jgi:hypothetical protein
MRAKLILTSVSGSQFERFFRPEQPQSKSGEMRVII